MMRLRVVLVVTLLVAVGCHSSSSVDEDATLRRLATSYVERGGQLGFDVMDGSCCAPGTRVNRASVRRSAIDPSWAKVTLQGTYDDDTAFDRQAVALHRGPTGWRVVDVSYDDCDLPKRVRRELRFERTTTDCPIHLDLPHGPTKVEEAGRGDVRARITYVDAFPDSIVDLDVERASRRVLHLRLAPVQPDVRGTNPEALHGGSALSVRDLDGDGEPEVLVDLFWGGAHCCTWTEVLRWNGSRYERQRHLWGNHAYGIEDLDHNGVPELTTADDRFAYAFAAYATSGYPLLVLHYEHGRFIDVTRSFPDAVEASSEDNWRLYEELTRSGDEGLGFLAAWAADECRLDRCDAAFGRITGLGQTTTTTSSVDPALQAPTWASYQTSLRTMLIRLGYRRSPDSPNRRRMVIRSGDYSSPVRRKGRRRSASDAMVCSPTRCEL